MGDGDRGRRLNVGSRSSGIANLLIVSGELEAVEQARRLGRGRSDRAFLAKPFNAATLCDAVERLLGSRGS